MRMRKLCGSFATLRNASVPNFLCFKNLDKATDFNDH